MDRSQLIRFYWFLILVLGLNVLALGQSVKPSYVLKYLSDTYENDPFLKEIKRYTLEALHNLDEVDVISPYTSSNYPAQYYLELKPSYAYYGWNGGTHHFIQDDTTRKRMCFEYRMNYGPKITCTLGDVVTGRVLDIYELKFYNTFPAERLCLDYIELGHEKGQVFEPAKLVEKLKSYLNLFFDDRIMKAEKALKNELSHAVYDVFFQFFPVRQQVIAFKSLRFDSVSVDVQGFEKYNLGLNKSIFVYRLKPFREGIDMHERIELLGEFYTTAKKGSYFNGIFTGAKNNITAALNNKETLWCSPIRLKSTFRQAEPPPAIAFNVRTSGVTIDKWVLNQLYDRLKAQILDARGKQLIILDRKKTAEIQEQRDENKSNSFLDKASIEQFKSIGARYIFDVEIQSAIPGNPAGNFSFNSRCVTHLIDVETNEIVAESVSDHGTWWSHKATIPTEIMEFKIMSAQSPETRLEFVKNMGLVSHLKFNVREVLNRAIPAKIEIFEVTEVEKDKAKQVLISGNFNERTMKDDYHVCVKKEINVDGTIQTRWETIGRVAITTPTGDGLALTKVKQGEKEIYAAFQKGVKLYCFDRPEWLIDGRFMYQLKAAGF
ncbi:hypothetical protein [Haliscomenobacter sp.]|jgi:hypothetical protein|uniref:hypothetical protein n=1 Tax=Haliscomenobacter sp. TaxID=2717303 RepID=UPI003364F8EA